MSKDKKLFQKYSGIEHEQFINLYKFLNPGKNGENIKYHNSALSKKIHILVNEEKSGPKLKLNRKSVIYVFSVAKKWIYNFAHVLVIQNIKIYTIALFNNMGKFSILFIGKYAYLAVTGTS